MKGKGKRHSAFRSVDWTEARIGRFPRPKKVPELPQQPSQRGLNIPFNAQFDDYFNGPSMDALLEVPPEIMGYDASLVYIANKILVSPWSTFKDYGYQLLPNFAQNYNLGEPIMFEDHLCPLGLPNPPSSLTDYHSERTGRGGAPVKMDDSVVMGAQELLDEANRHGEDTVLLTGKNQEGGYDQYVMLDLQRDSVEVAEIVYSCDIDSLIWITRNPKFIGPLGVYSSPMIRDRAPIWKNNHVRVELLFPQSEEDMMGPGPREEWLTKPRSLSNIPHLCFGTVSPGTSSADILLFFPRMAHKDPHRHYWVNRIPKHIQDILWDRVIIPALRSILEETEAVYFPLDRQHWRLREELGKNTKRVAQYPVQGDRMGDVVKEMTRLVSKDPLYCLVTTNMAQIKKGGDTLAHLGSFFFVVQVKGSKRLAHSQGSSLGESTKEALGNFQRSFTGLDWDYMADRKEGELICDVGITIQPSDDEEELVGLWRLDCLEASYGAGGYLSGNIHTLNTLSMYGGLQAESPAWRRRRTHISFRSSYNLAYKAIRQHDNTRNMFEEKEVYNRSPWFQHQLTKVLEIYDSKACKQSYGVRDEFRISGRAVQDLIECVDDSICFNLTLITKEPDVTFKQMMELLESNPVLWLPSEIWFSFLSRRLSILNDVHEKIYRLQPPNYGILSRLFAYLMQSVMFTPPIVNSYVRDSLASLQYKRNCDVFGMFFLDTLDVDNPSCMIDGILEKDDSTVKCILGPLLRKPRFAAFRRQEDEGENEYDDELYPLGPTPTWKEITRSIGSNPTILIRPWEGLPADLIDYSEPRLEDGSMKQRAGLLFAKFTRQLWMSLNEGWRIDPGFQIAPESVEEALTRWTVDFVLERCLDPIFQACAIPGLRHVSGRHVASFGERMKLYFPSSQDRSKEKCNFWTSFGEAPGYLHDYREMIEGFSDEEVLELQMCLEELLENCQCLPDSVRSKSTN